MEIKIKYSGFSILLYTVILIGLVLLFISILSNQKATNGEWVFILLSSVIYLLILINWIDLFFIPYIKGKPALIVNSEGLFVTSIGQLILWDEIKETKIVRGQNNYTILIFVKNGVNISIVTNSITKRFWCGFSEMLFNTPFSFSTMFIKGRGRYIYGIIKSKGK